MAWFRRRKTDDVALVEGVDIDTSAARLQTRTMDEHLAAILGEIEPLPPFGIQLLDTVGLTLCEDVLADVDLPAFTYATIDGFGVRSADLITATADDPVRLPLIDAIDAAGFAGAPVDMAAAVRVVVGAPLPERVDTVLPPEAVTEAGDWILIWRPIPSGLNVRPRGSDVSEGDALVTFGSVIDAQAVGVLAEAGHDKILVRPRPRVIVATIGDNLVMPGLPLTSLYQTYDATTPMIAAAARDDGAQVFAIAPVANDATQVREMLADQAIRADLIITIGGLEGRDACLTEAVDGVGTADFTPVMMDPGWRQGFGRVGHDQTMLIMLPASPVGAFLTYQAFARPAIRALGGHSTIVEIPKALPLAVDVRNPSNRTRLVPGQRTPRGVMPLESTRLASSIGRADVILILPPGPATFPAHSDVKCWTLETRPS